jgi:hypothetical protein
MGKMKELRTALMNDLAVLGIPVMDDWEIRADPPCIYLTPPRGGFYLQAADKFGSYFIMSLDLVVLVEARPANEGRDDLEDLLEDVLRNTADWTMTGVDPPGMASKGDSTIDFLGTVVHLDKELDL